MTRSYDFIMAGGGGAGLSLAFHLARSPLRDRSMLIVDRDAKRQNDRTWCFWTDRPTPFDGVAYRSWKRIRFIGEQFDRIIPLAPYRYVMLRGLDFYNFARQTLAALPGVSLAQGAIERIEDGGQQARVVVDGTACAGAWVFDSLLDPSRLALDPVRYHYLKQHFKGWEIQTPSPAFDPEVVTLFDFRTAQKGDMRFFYVLPFSATQALVEYTIFSADLLAPQEYVDALKHYVETTLGLPAYQIVAEENGNIPMTDHPFPRRAGRRVMTIGTKGGRVKPSTGYAFWRIQQDSAAIVNSLVGQGHPFDVRPAPARYRLFDSIMLQVMHRRGGCLKQIFTDLFKNNPIDRIFRFLDETGAWGENVRLMASLPAQPFVRALLKLMLLRRV